MALPILDGNQSATTLSTIFTAGAHIPAHTVVSLGSQAISDIGSAVSGISVSIGGTQSVTGSVSVLNFPSTQTISGTVTANLTTEAFTLIQGGIASDDGGQEPPYGVQIGYWDSAVGEYRLVRPSYGLPVSGTVTANVFGNNSINGGQIAVKLDDEGAVFVKQQSAIQVEKMPSGALTTRFGSVATANLAFITSAVTNASRKYLLAQNISAGAVTIGIGFSPTTTQGIQLPAGGGLTFDAFCPTGAVYWLGAVTGAAYTILEG